MSPQEDACNFASLGAVDAALAPPIDRGGQEHLEDSVLPQAIDARPGVNGRRVSTSLSLTVTSDRLRCAQMGGAFCAPSSDYPRSVRQKPRPLEAAANNEMRHVMRLTEKAQPQPAGPSPCRSCRNRWLAISAIDDSAARCQVRSGPHPEAACWPAQERCCRRRRSRRSGLCCRCHRHHSGRC